MKKVKISASSRLVLRRLGISFGVAVVILLAEYLLSNWCGYIFEDIPVLSMVDKICPQQEPDDNDDVIYFNLAYDKQLVAVRDEKGDSIGNTVITNRAVLLKLLDIVEQSNYRYLLLDIRFEKETQSALDSLLFAKLRSMKNLVISTHSNIEPALDGQQFQTGYADYLSTYFSGFTNYGYLQGDSTSVALKMYRDIDGGDVRRFGPLFFSDGRLCNNMQFLTFYESDVDKTDTPAFGGEYLTEYNPTEIARLLDGKIVAVGDLSADTHLTYTGRIPGPLLNIRAYESLRRGRHLINFGLVMFLMAFYSLCCYLILYSHTLKFPERISKFLHRHPMIAFCMFLLGWSFILLILKIFVFLVSQYSLIIAIPSVVFTLLSMPSNYGEFKRKNLN